MLKPKKAFGVLGPENAVHFLGNHEVIFDMASRGRPVKSEIRQNIIEIINVIGSAYGYLIHKYYNELFPSCTRENIYYNLRKGVKLGEFELAEVKQEKGAYSWGTVVEKKYYKLGANAAPRGNPKVKDFFDKLKPRK